MSEELLVLFYASGDAFILPTRGEGWGLPLVEAMSMGLPVLSPSYSGVSGFLRDDVYFQIPLDGIEEVPPNAMYGYHTGMKWGVPCVNGASQLLRYVVSHPEHAKRVGARGRRHVLAYFTEEAVADRITDALEEKLKHKVNKVD